jgi:hypothetical protein
MTLRVDHHRPYLKTPARAGICNAGSGLVQRMAILARNAVAPSAGRRMAGIVIIGTTRKGVRMVDTTRGAVRKKSSWKLTARLLMTHHQDPERVVDGSGTDQGEVGVAVGVRVRKVVATESLQGDVVVAVEAIAQLIAARTTMNRIGEVVESTAIARAVGVTEVDQTAVTKATRKSDPRKSGKIDVRVMSMIEGKVKVIERRAAGIVTKEVKGRIRLRAAKRADA